MSGYYASFLETTNRVRRDKRAKAKCKVGKPCGDICIPKAANCNDVKGLTQSVKRNAPAIGAVAVAAGAVGAGALLSSQAKPTLDKTPIEQATAKSPTPAPQRLLTSSKTTPEAKPEPKQEAIPEPESESLKQYAEQVAKEKELIKKNRDKLNTESQEAIAGQLAKEMGWTMGKALKELGLSKDVEEVLASKPKQNVPLYKGRSRNKADIQVNNNDIDIAKTLKTLQVGEQGAPVRDVNEIAQSIRDHHRSRLSEEYTKGVDKLIKGHNTAVAATLVSRKKEEAKDRVRMQTARRIQEYNQTFSGIAKQHLGQVDLALRQFGEDVVKSQVSGKPIVPERTSYFQEVLSSKPLSNTVGRAADRVKELIPRSHNTPTTIKPDQAKRIIERTNQLLKRQGKKRIRVDSGRDVTSSAYYQSFVETTNRVRRDKARSRAKCKKGKPCGDICIPRDAECKATVVSATDKKLIGAGLLGVAGVAVAHDLNVMRHHAVHQKASSTYNKNLEEWNKKYAGKPVNELTEDEWKQAYDEFQANKNEFKKKVGADPDPGFDDRWKQSVGAGKPKPDPIKNAQGKPYWDVLGVDKTATPDQIKKAYRKQAAKHHPDAGGNADQFREVTEAYEKAQAHKGSVRGQRSDSWSEIERAYQCAIAQHPSIPADYWYRFSDYDSYNAWRKPLEL